MTGQRDHIRVTMQLAGASASRNPSSAPRPTCFFEIYREEEVSVTSTLFCGGDWHWRLVDAEAHILVEAGGYNSERKCRRAVSILQGNASLAGLHAARRHVRRQHQ